MIMEVIKLKILETIDININSELRDIENFLRDNITFILKNKYGNAWENNLGVSEERINIWKERKIEEKKRLNGNEIENRLLYYSDFYDLKTIIDKNWDIFKDIFKIKSEIDYQLEQLESYRNPNAHHRDLLDYQKCLLVGLVGEIKTQILAYRGNLEKVETFFPKIESIIVNRESFSTNLVRLKTTYHIGDTIQIIVYVSSPPNQKIQYCISKPINEDECNWQNSNSFLIKIDEADVIGDNSLIIKIKSDQKYHKCNYRSVFDDRASISYVVLPKI